MSLHHLIRQYFHPRLKLLFFINLACYSLLILFGLCSLFVQTPLVNISRSFFILLVTLPLTGLNLTALLEYFFHQKFTPLEKLFLATLVAFVVPPLFLSVIYSFFYVYHPLFIFNLSLGASILACTLHPVFLDQHAPDSLPKTLPWTLSLATLIYITVITVVVTSYYALPDLDPYYWLRLYQENFLKHILAPLSAYRPLFSSLSSIFYASAGIDFFAYFKYVLPYFLLTLLLPLALIAKRFQNPVIQLMIFSTPFITPSFLLYTLTPIPQALLNLSLIFFSICLLHSYFSRNNFFFFTSGIFILGASLYHEVAIIFFVFWFLISLLYFQNSIKKAYQESPLLLTALTILILLQLLKLFKFVLLFFTSWIHTMFSLIIKSSLNLSYPATYVNIDGNAVGWSTPLGVLKYYSFYAGPVFMLLVITLVIILLQKKPLRIASKEFWVLTISTLSFFALAEILPRFFNIAALPERAWGFLALLVYFLFILLLAGDYFPDRPRYRSLLPLCLILAFSINIGGALYINHLKQYLITPAQINSANWIKDNLPEEKVIFTHNNESLLRTHAQATILHSSDPGLYQDIRIFALLLKKQRLASLDIDATYTDYLDNLSEYRERLKSYDLADERESLIADTEYIKESTDIFLKYIKNDTRTPEIKKAIYIYYAEPSPLNPYSKRPYSAHQDSSAFIFDTKPEHFQRVYSLPNDEIVIWQYIP